MEPCLLCIESSSKVCSVAVFSGQRQLSLIEDDDGQNHGRFLTVYIRQALASANLEMKQLTHIVVSHGPGSYTGLRIGASVAKTMAYALEVPLVAVSTLEALARQGQKLKNDGRHIALQDARRNDVYAIVMEKDGQILKNAHFTTIDDVWVNENLSSDDPNYVSGEGFYKFDSIDPGKMHLEEIPIRASAKNLVESALEKINRAEFEDIDHYEPYYMKPPNITVPKRKNPLF